MCPAVKKCEATKNKPLSNINYLYYQIILVWVIYDNGLLRPWYLSRPYYLYKQTTVRFWHKAGNITERMSAMSKELIALNEGPSW